MRMLLVLGGILSAVIARADVACPGAYTNHLQGVAADEAGNFYWSFTTSLVKTDKEGALLCKVDAPWHYGDLAWHGGKVFGKTIVGSVSPVKIETVLSAPDVPPAAERGAK